ncbi:alpha/beta fold hydrolase [Actinokineospora sp. PR83]|uniref:alpha/beta hydrolase n=1 Tax=Actinokineospora sp. PR83 TaxID=2884908 RepID=UPI0027E1AF41|nr:alpha/beta hydrolase [Actinokineospora sp. PR83]MCG8914205.1 alpha/beta fold hydrolase [Actinokineospora sp. PR83]
MILARSYGTGDPRTLVVPGLGATAGEARIPASGLPSTRTVLTLPSHADNTDAPSGYWRYATLARDVAAVLGGTRRAVGVSLGAAALCALVAADPTALDRLVLLLPGALSKPRPAPSAALVLAMADAADAGDRAGLRALVAPTVPPGTGSYVEDRTAALLRLGPALRAVATEVPVPDPAALADVRARVLVVAATGDPVHPAEVAEEAAAAFPRAELVRYDSPAPLVTHRRELRALLAAFLGRPD